MNLRLLIVVFMFASSWGMAEQAWAVSAAGVPDMARGVADSDQSVTAPADPNSGKWTRRGAGCLGGAVLGFVLPGLGNIIGCVVGAVVFSVQDVFAKSEPVTSQSIPAATVEE